MSNRSRRPTTSSSPASAPPRRSAGPRRRPGRPCWTARSASSALTEPWAEKYDLPVRIYAPLAVDPTEVLPRVEARRLDRCQQVALDRRPGGLDGRRARPSVDPERLGVVVGTGIGGALTLLGQDDILEQQGVRKVAVLTVPMLMPNGPAAAVGLWAKARGGVHAPVSACASGAEAHRLGLPADQGRGARHRHRRRRRGLHSPAADGRLRPDAGDEHPQRRPAGRVPAVRHGARRLRARRGRRHHGAGAAPTTRRPAARRSTAGWPASGCPTTRTTSPRRSRRARVRRGRSPRRSRRPA